MKPTARELALKILYRVFEEGGYSNIALNDLLKQFDGDPRDKSFITELVYGTVERKNTLDWIISLFSRRKPEKIDHLTLNVLRTAVYQIFYLEKIPDPVAVNEAVKTANRIINPGAAKFINGVLRSLIRGKSGIVFPDPINEPERYISLKYSHPEWLIKHWLNNFSFDFVKALCDANNDKPRLTVRVNTLKVDIDEAKSSLEKDGFTVCPCRFVPEGLNISGPLSLTLTEAYSKGWIQPQDEGSMLVSHMLSPEPRQLVIDVCAGPGGKTTHIAQLMSNQGRVVSRDIFKHKINLIENLSQRLGITIIETELADGRVVDKKLQGRADRVLVDAPCMGFGIIRRKPDIKWNRKPEDLHEIVEMQRQILKASAELLKPGGILVYSTCSIGPDENSEVVKDFLNKNDSFELSNIPSKQIGLFESDAQKPFIQLYPHVHKTDGFFMARILRTR